MSPGVLIVTEPCSRRPICVPIFLLIASLSTTSRATSLTLTTSGEIVPYMIDVPTPSTVCGSGITEGIPRKPSVPAPTLTTKRARVPTPVTSGSKYPPIIATMGDIGTETESWSR